MQSLEQIIIKRIDLFDRLGTDDDDEEEYMGELRALLEEAQHIPEQVAAILVDIGIHFGSRKSDEARKMFEAALKCSPISNLSKGMSFTGIAMTLATNKEHKKAEKIARQALSILGPLEIGKLEPESKIEAFQELRHISTEQLAKRIIERCRTRSLSDKYEKQ